MFKNIKKLKKFFKYTVRNFYKRILIKTISLRDLSIVSDKLIRFMPRDIFLPDIYGLSINGRDGNKENPKMSIYRTPEIFSCTIPDAIYYSPLRTVFTKDHKLIKESILCSKPVERTNIQAIKKSALNRISGYASIFRGGTRYTNYFHNLIDYIPRLYLLEAPEYRSLKKIRLLIHQELTPLEQYVLPKLLPENVELYSVSRDGAYVVEKLLFPTFFNCRERAYFPREYINWFLNKVGPGRKRKKDKRVLILRRKQHERRGNQARSILNDDELSDILRRYGFEKYYLENLSIKEQIDLFYDAQIVIGVHGAGLANLVFSEGVKVLELFPSTAFKWFFYLLTESIGGDYGCWFGKAVKFNDNFHVDVSDVAEWASSFSGS